MELEKYIKERVEEQINWLNKKSRTYKLLHISISCIEIIITSFIAFFSGFAIESYNSRLIIGILSTIMIVLISIDKFMKFKELWTQYKVTSEILISEKYKYITNKNNSEKRLFNFYK